MESEKLVAQAKLHISQGKKVSSYVEHFDLGINNPSQKDRALLLLKLKKHKEKEVSNIDGQLMNILEMVTRDNYVA